MHNGLSIYQTKYCKTTFLALLRLSYIISYHLAVGKTALLRQKSQQTHYYYRIATKLAKAYQYLLLQFQWNIDEYKKACAARKISPNDKFWSNDKLTFFWPNYWVFLHGMSVKFGLWTFHKLQNRQKNWLYWLLVALLIMLMLLLERARGRLTWSLRANWCPWAPCWWPLCHVLLLPIPNKAW